MFQRKAHRSFSPSVPWWVQEGHSATRSASLKAAKPPTQSSYKPHSSTDEFTDSTDFYDNFDQDNEQNGTEDELLTWIRQDPTRGAVRVYRPEGTYSDLVRCTLMTPAGTIMSKCLSKELYVVFGGHHVKKLNSIDYPLSMQTDYLRMVGYSDAKRIQEEGHHLELANLIKFVTGFESGSEFDNKVFLKETLKVKEGGFLGGYSKRLCILCCTRLYVYKFTIGGAPQSKPHFSITLSEMTIANHSSSSHRYCTRLRPVMDREPEIVLAFSTLIQQNQWTERIKKMSARPFKTVHLNACGLEEIPEYLLLDPTIHTLHLTKNYLVDKSASLEASDHGWLSSIQTFSFLTSLSLRDNKLDSFPLAICQLKSLTELNLSCNSIKEVPSDIGYLQSLLVLQMQSNLLTNLPYHMRHLHVLITLSVSFNRLTEIPHVVKELRLLKTLLAAGNMITEIPEDIHKMNTLEELDIRLNNITVSLPHTLQGLKNLRLLRINGNGLPDVNTSLIPSVEKLDCSSNKMEALSLGSSASTLVLAKYNNISQIFIEGQPIAKRLTTLDLSRNKLWEIPEELSQFPSLHHLDLSYNELSALPVKIFNCKSLQFLSVSHNQLTALPTAKGASNLEQFSVHCNNLEKLPLSFVSHANKLQVLNVSCNQLEQLPALPPMLTELYASDNLLTQVDFISHCSNLKVIHLAYNRISSISANFFISFKYLDVLGLAGNNLASFPVSVGACQKLQSLYLNGNKLSELPTLTRNHHLTTVDVSHNQIRNVEQTWVPKKLINLDVSGNVALSSSVGVLSRNLHSVSHIVFEGKALRGKGSRVATGGIPAHGRWIFGSSHVPSASTLVKSTEQVKETSLNGGQDGLLAIIDGNASPDVPHILQSLLVPILTDELKQSPHEENGMLYFEHTFLTLHRQLGNVGHQMGASVLLCHLVAADDNHDIIHIANTGLNEAILCRDGEAIKLTSPHVADKNKDERKRVVELKGFITKDGMVNAACKSSRLIGCYQHHPHVIPLPSTTSVQLTEDDEFLVIANAPFWACISHEEAVSQVRNVADSKIAASKLRDLALTHGSKEEISIIVIRFLNSRFVPQYRKSATTEHSDVKAARPKTIHGESSIHYSTASLGRMKHREPVDAENPLQKRTKSIYSVTTQPQPQQQKVTARPLNHHVDTPSDENSQVVMRKTKSDSNTKQDNERHQKALSASPDQVPIHSNKPISQPEHKNIRASLTNYTDSPKGSSQKTKAVTKKKTAELSSKIGGWKTKDIKNDVRKKASTTASVQSVPTHSNKPVSQSKQKSTHANPISTTKGILRETDAIIKKKTELNHKPGELGAKVTSKKTSTPDPTKNKQFTQLKIAHVNPTSFTSKDKSVEVDVTKMKQVQAQNEVQHQVTDHVKNAHKTAKTVVPDITPPINKPVVNSQHKPVDATTTSYDDQLISTKSPADSHDEQSSFNALHHSSSDSLADKSLLNQSMDATWFESMPPLQLDGFDTFGLELGMLSDMGTNSSEVTNNVVFGGQKDWGVQKHANTQPAAPSVMDAELEEAKANFNFDELIAGLNNTWMTTLQSIPTTTSDTSPNVNTTTTTKPLKRDDSILSASLMAQFEQPSVEEDDEELDNLISQLNEFVDDPF